MKSKNYSIEVLRVFSMFCILGTHIISVGGIGSSLEFLSDKYLIFSVLSTIGRYGVGIFILITGYLMKDKQFKIIRLVEIFLYLFIYSVLSVLIVTIFFPQYLNLRLAINSLLPFLFGNYWYLIAYTVLFVFGPFVNIMLENLTRRSYNTMIFFGLFLFSIITTFTNSDVFIIKDGHSPLWMIFFYSIGYYIRKFELVGKLKQSALVILFMGSLAFTIIGNLIVAFVGARFLSENMFITTSFFNAYTSPTIIIATVSMFLFIMNMNISRNKCLTLLSEHSFAVYLIHANPVWLQGPAKNSLITLSNTNVFLMLFIFVVMLIGIYSICVLIDILTVKALEKFKINELVRYIFNYFENKIVNSFNKIIDRDS